MGCERREEVGAFIDGELPEEKRRLIERHIQECEECALEAAALRRMASWRELMVEERPTEEEWEACWRKIKTETTRLLRRRRNTLHVLRLGGMAAAAVLLFLAMLVFLPREEPNPAGEPTAEPPSGDLDIIDYGGGYAPVHIEREDVTIIRMVGESPDDDLPDEIPQDIAPEPPGDEGGTPEGVGPREGEGK